VSGNDSHEDDEPAGDGWTAIAAAVTPKSITVHIAGDGTIITAPPTYGLCTPLTVTRPPKRT
jgi:hypothetical protein